MTRRICLLSWALLLIGCISLMLPTFAEARARLSLDNGWVFQRDSQGGEEKPDYDDSKWLKVSVPHSFNAGDGADGGGNYWRGTAWYRRGLEMQAIAPGKRYYLQFDGAGLVTDVYVNGVRLGRHDGGYSIFRYDITRALKAGRNVIAVKVDNRVWPQVSPLGGDFTIFGGIDRHVWLVETADLAFDLSDLGSEGVRISTRVELYKWADVTVTSRVANIRPGGGSVTVRTRIFDAEGKEVLSQSKKTRVGAGVSPVVQTLRLTAPRAWDGRRDPYLYNVVVDLIDSSGAILDSVVEPLGVRTVEFDPERGLILNGRPYAVYGVNMHAQRAGKGSALDDADIEQDFDILDELGVTGLRLAHYPHAQKAYEEADRRGILILTEIPFNSQFADTPAFRANAATQLRELIRQHGNHPSIIAWGIGNEIFSTDPAVPGILMELNDVATTEDPTRRTIYAHCCQPDNHPKAQQSGLIGFNRYFGWYSGAMGDIATWADDYHSQFPEKPFAITEYGAGGSLRQQVSPAPASVVPTSDWHPESYQLAFHETYWAAIKARPYIWGSFVWNAFDFASDGRNEGDQAGINDKGLVSADRQVRKDAFYFYKAQWSRWPFVHIVEGRRTQRAESVTDIRVFAIAGMVTLKVNGVVIGKAAPEGGEVTFKAVTLKPGGNEIVVEGDTAGSWDRAVWSLEPAVTGVAR